MVEYPKVGIENQKILPSHLSLVQNSLCDALVKLVNEFDNEGITYWLNFGSLLGAIRGENLIPWDDDIDLSIMYSDTNKVLDLVTSRLQEYFLIEYPNRDNPILPPLKLILRGTRITEQNTLDEWGIDTSSYLGFSIDIFPVFSCSSTRNIILRIAQVLNNIWLDKQFASHITITKLREKTTFFQIRCLLIRLFPRTFLIKLKDVLQNLLTDENSLYVRYMLGSTCFNEQIMKTNLFPISRTKLRNRNFSVPRNSREVLRNFYGDNFMQLPPVEERITHFISGYVSVKSPFYKFFDC